MLHSVVCFLWVVGFVTNVIHLSTNGKPPLSIVVLFYGLAGALTCLPLK